MNVHRSFFKRPDQAEWPDYTLHIDGVTGKRVMFREWVRDMEDLSTAFAAQTSEGCMGLRGWGEGEGAQDVFPGGKEIIGIMSENSSVSAEIDAHGRDIAGIADDETNGPAPKRN
jgi:hypothetical protein